MTDNNQATLIDTASQITVVGVDFGPFHRAVGTVSFEGKTYSVSTWGFTAGIDIPVEITVTYGTGQTPDQMSGWSLSGGGGVIFGADIIQPIGPVGNTSGAASVGLQLGIDGHLTYTFINEIVIDPVGSGLAAQSPGSAIYGPYSGRVADGRGLRAGDELHYLDVLAELRSRPGNEVSHSEIYRNAHKGEYVSVYELNNIQDNTLNCFPSGTLIQTPSGEIAIEALGIGDLVLAFDPNAEGGRGALVPRSVKQLFNNTTTEFLRLTWDEGGETKSLVTTPGHEFLCEDGSFAQIGSMVQNGAVRIVLESGTIAICAVEHLMYAAETAELFEQSALYGAISGALALKAEDGWKTYNFEVEELHTYVAEGVRVHNLSFGFGDDTTITTVEQHNSFVEFNLSTGQSVYVGEDGMGVLTDTDVLEYVASHNDLMNYAGTDTDRGADHFFNHGLAEARQTTFDGMEYLASHGDLMDHFDTNEKAALEHYIEHGRHEGRNVSFDSLEYIASHEDLMNAFGAN